MNIIDNRIADLVPAHYREYAPRFIIFLEKYYEWLHRVSGMTDAEIQELRDDTSWLEKDIDRFIATGQMRYMDQTVSSTALDLAIIETNSISNPGVQTDNLQDNFVMENGFTGYTTTNGEVFEDNNDAAVELSTIENNILDGWFNSMGFDRIKRARLAGLNNIDQVLMLSLLKHIYAIKGTETSIKLFFSLFFDEVVTIYQPKADIAVIDENWVLDDIQVLRDDILYQEFSYVINVADPVEDYKEIFDSIYLKIIHPAGFYVKLVQI